MSKYINSGRKLYTLQEDCMEAIKNDDLDKIGVLLNTLSVRVEYYYQAAIKLNKPNVVDYLLKNHMKYYEYSLYFAALHESYDVLLLLLKHYCTWSDPNALTCVIDRIDRNCRAIEIAKSMVVISEDRGICNKNDSFIMYKAFQVESLVLIKFLHEHGFTYNKHLYEVCYANVDILKYLYEDMGVREDKQLVSNCCVESGNIECLEYLLAKDSIAITPEVTSTALYGYHKEMVKYLHQKGYEWDPDFDTGYIEDSDVKKYCHDNNIPKRWDCYDNCKLCLEQRIDTLKDLWILEEERYNSMIQWPPREILEDLIELVGV